MTQTLHTNRTSLVFATLACSFFGLIAASRALADSGTYVGPIPIERVVPTYPRKGLENHHEAVVMMEFVVDESGRAKDFQVAHNSGDVLFEHAAKRAVEQWQFEPATLDGEPIQSFPVVQSLIFEVTNAKNGVDATFSRRYDKATEFLETVQLDKAEKLIEQFFTSGRLTLRELGFAKFLEARFFAASGRQDEQLRNLRLIEDLLSNSVPPAVRINVLADLLVAEYRARNYAEVVHLAQRLPRVEGSVKISEQLAPTIDRIRAVAASDRPLKTEHELGESGRWTGRPLRRGWEIATDASALHQVGAACGNFSIRADYRDGEIFSIPSDWSDCKVTVWGEPGAKFTLLQNGDSALSPPAAE